VVAGKDGNCVIVQGTCVPVGVARELVACQKAPPEVCQLEEREEETEDARAKFGKQFLAEAIGTGMIVLFGCGSVCSSLSTAYQGIWQVAVVWGFGVSLAIYSTADISGAHLNLAVTLAFQLVRPGDMTITKSFAYVLAQFLGAMLGGLINLAVYSNTIEAFERANGIVRGEPKSMMSALAFGEYFPNPGLTAP